MAKNDPVFLERTASGAILAEAATLLQERRTIFLMEQINVETVNCAIRQMIILDHQSDRPITMVIGSPGGDIQQGLALMDVMQSCRCTVRTVAVGLAASMASVLLAAGTPGERYCTKHSRVMIHEPLLNSGLSGSCSTIQETAKHILERKELLNKLLSSFTKRTRKEIEKATAYDHYFSAEEAVAFGLVDHVTKREELMELLGGVEEYDLG